jgi:DNA-binding transcriptional LysR family regulator
LQVFRAVLIAGTETRASEIMGLSQPTISALLSGLERELGFKLFIRVKGRLQPTVEAGYFFQSVDKIISGFENLGQIAKDIREANAGNIRIAAVPAIAVHILPRVIARFRAQHPEVRFDVQTQSSHIVREWLSTQQFDIGFAELPIDVQSVDVDKLSYRCVCIMPEGHPLAAREIITPADLVNEPLIIPAKEHMVTFQLRQAFAEAGCRIEPLVESQLMIVIGAIVAQGNGVGIVDPFTAAHFDGRGAITRAFSADIKLDLAAIFPNTRPRSRITEAFYALFREEFATYGGGDALKGD